MKTFKLVSLMVLHRDEPPNRIEEIPLIDGLIINQEDGENSWFVEALVDKKYKPIFEKAYQNNVKLNLQVTITKKSNDPASLLGTVKIIKEMEQHVSVLLEGNLVSSRLKWAEIILNDLINQGLQGHDLLSAFKTKLQEVKKSLQS